MSLLYRVPSRGFSGWRDFSQLQNEVSRLFEGFTRGVNFDEFPAMNIHGNEDALLLEMEMPGIDPEKLEITVLGETVTVRGERKPETVEASEAFHRRERPAGKFTRTLQLPFAVDGDKAEADYQRGILTIKLPRPEASRPRKVTVRG